MLPPPRNIARYTTIRGPNVYLVIHTAPLIPRYLDYQRVCAFRNFQVVFEYFRAYAGRHTSLENVIFWRYHKRIFFAANILDMIPMQETRTIRSVNLKLQ